MQSRLGTGRQRNLKQGWPVKGFRIRYLSKIMQCWEQRGLCASFCIAAVGFPIAAATQDVTPMAKVTQIYSLSVLELRSPKLSPQSPNQGVSETLIP